MLTEREELPHEGVEMGVLFSDVRLQKSCNIVLSAQHLLHVSHGGEHFAVDCGQHGEPPYYQRRPAHLYHVHLRLL